MKATNGFDVITQNNNNLNEYSLTPGIWQAMSEVKKMMSVSIVAKHG